MTPSTSRVASRHLQKQATTDMEQVLSELHVAAMAVSDQQALLVALQAAGERRRLGRVTDVQPTDIKFNGQALTASVIGTTGEYETRITFQPRRGHHCTCPDWKQNGMKVGPCKHVLALGSYWLQNKVEPVMQMLFAGTENLVTDANGVLY